jgi:hypothetical protein
MRLRRRPAARKPPDPTGDTGMPAEPLPTADGHERKIKNLEGPISMPDEPTAPTGRASTGGRLPFGADRMPNRAVAEEILAWGPDEDPVVNRRAGRSDFVLRALTALAVAGSIVFIAMGLADHRQQHANETTGDHRITPQEVATQIGPNLLPLCLADWPYQRRMACPQLIPNTSESAERNCLPTPFTHASRICGTERRTQTPP